MVLGFADFGFGELRIRSLGCLYLLSYRFLECWMLGFLDVGNVGSYDFMIVCMC